MHSCLHNEQPLDTFLIHLIIMLARAIPLIPLLLALRLTWATSSLYSMTLRLFCFPIMTWTSTTMATLWMCKQAIWFSHRLLIFELISNPQHHQSISITLPWLFHFALNNSKAEYHPIYNSSATPYVDSGPPHLYPPWYLSAFPPPIVSIDRISTLTPEAEII